MGYPQAIAEAMARVGDAQAQGVAAKGRLWGGAVANMGDLASQAFQQSRQDKVRQQEAALRDQQLTESRQRTKLEGEAGTRAATAFSANQAASAREQAEQMHARTVSRLGAVRGKPQLWGATRAGIIADGLAKPEEIPAQYPGDDAIDAELRGLMSAKEQWEAGQPKLHNVPEGESVIDEHNPGAGPVYTAPPKPKDPQKYKVTVAGPDGKPIEKLFTEEELAAGVPGYVAPPAPQQPSQDIVQVMGPNGVPIWVRKGDAVGQPAAQAPRAVTGQERQTLAFYNRAKDAVSTITDAPDGGDSMEQRIAGMSLISQERLQHAPNFLQSEEGQKYRQAQRAFTEARLRKESGAAIPTAEYENDARTYFAQPGDGKNIIEQKRKARQTVLDGLKFSAGKAYEEYYGEPNVSPARTNPSSGGSGKQKIGRFEVEVH